MDSQCRSYPTEIILYLTWLCSDSSFYLTAAMGNQKIYHYWVILNLSLSNFEMTINVENILEPPGYNCS